jgi:polyketide synthase PksN
MIDFIEYVVAELKRKRLSRADALELIRQFSRKPPGAGRPEAPQASLHPLLQANTSDLSRLGFSSVFTGEEPFLADHRILLEGQARKVLPGAAYLEMARAAAERVFRTEAGAGILKLTGIVWLHPLVVEEPTEVSLTLYADDTGGVPEGEEGIGFEISSASREARAGWHAWRPPLPPGWTWTISAAGWEGCGWRFPGSMRPIAKWGRNSGRPIGAWRKYTWARPRPWPAWCSRPR